MTLYERHTTPGDNGEPVLVVALEGWIDAGLGASGAMAELLGAGPTELVATFDGEVLIDQRARRPVAHIVQGVNERLVWPTIELRAGHDLDGEPVLFLVGPEPDFRWRSFVAAVAELCAALRVRLAVGLGAFPAPAPHTRPVRLAGTAPEQSAELVAGVGVVQGSIEVPAGVWSALELGFGAAGVPAVGLWARVPHYVAGMNFLPASAALLDGLLAVSGLRFDTAEMRTRADAALGQVDELIGRSAEHLDLVRQLERNLDAAEGNPLDIGQVPTGDELAAELERFLRSEHDGPEGGEPQ